MHTGKPSQPRRGVPKCPDCGGPLLRRTSTQKHALLRVVTLRCDNDECGASFTAHEEIVYRLSPSSSPNPDIHLPSRAERMAATV